MIPDVVITVSGVIMATLITLIGVLIGYLIKVGRSTKKGSLIKKALIVTVVVLITIPVSLYVIDYLQSSPAPGPYVSITSPLNGTVVNINQEVTGKSANIPADSKVWVAVHAGDIYFPQPEPRIDEFGNWKCNATFGGLEHGGLSFDIIALIADRNAQSSLTDNPEMSVFPPDGATIYQTITVSRNGIQPTSTPTPIPTTTPTPMPTVTPTPTLVPDKTSVAITYPTNNSQVNISEWVSGTSQNVPSDQKLWILVHEGNLYFPTIDRVQINTDGTWKYNLTIGQTGDTGKSFDIITVLADSSAQSAVQSWYQQPYDLTNPFPGMTQYNNVTVTRR